MTETIDRKCTTCNGRGVIGSKPKNFELKEQRGNPPRISPVLQSVGKSHD